MATQIVNLNHYGHHSTTTRKFYTFANTLDAVWQGHKNDKYQRMRMTNRRQFIKSGLAFSALSITELTALKTAVAASGTPELRLEDFVYDTRFPSAVELARQVENQGVALAAMSGDLTDLWYHRYSRHWKQAPMTLAGVTASDGLFVLETLAADHRMQVIHRSVLAVPSNYKNHSPNETLYTWIIAPRDLQQRSA
ncbi:MAG: hypothetical protein RQ899_09650 [Pseudomonadales bacterium]|nr:hypothetical protein [Pseudomonadales bacterium]